MKKLHALAPVANERQPLAHAFETVTQSALETAQILADLDRELATLAERITAIEQSPARRPLLTKTETAEYLKISLSKLSEMISAGELPVVRLPGGHPRFRADDLDAWIETRTVAQHD